MNSSMSKLGIDHLTFAEKNALIGDIWESMANDVDAAPLTKAQQDEVDRRLAAHRANPDAAIPWNLIETEALDRLMK